MYTEQLNPRSCRTYMVGNAQNVIFIDPIIDHFSDYLHLLEERRLHLTHVIDTHTHADHISAGGALRDATGCDYVMHENAPAPCVTIHVKGGETLELNGIPVRFLYTPGHTRDSISVLIGDQFFTGDFLFLDDAGGGRDDLPGGDPAAHWESLRQLDTLPEDVTIYPSHEYNDRKPSPLKIQRQTNPHLKPRSKADFVRYLDDLRLGPADWMKDVLKANYTCAHSPEGVWIPIDLPSCAVKGTMEKGVNEIGVQYLGTEALAEKLRAEPKPVLIDVREPQELAGELKALPDVLHVPIGTLGARLPELEPYKQAEIVLICRSGARATTGAQILIKAGFTDVKVLEGGMTGWRMRFGAQP